MIRAALIDDEEAMLVMVENYIKEIKELREKLKLCTFSAAEKLFAYIEKRELENVNETIDILIIDVELQGMNGIELARVVRKRWPRVYLIFLTSHEKFAVESYILEAYQYIMKRDMKTRLGATLCTLVQKIEREDREYVLIENNMDMRKLYYRDIICIYKAKGTKYIQYMTINEEYRERNTLEKVLEKIDSRAFVLVDRGIAVNIKYITRVKGNNIYLDNREQITVSRARLVKVKEQINLYWRDT